MTVRPFTGRPGEVRPPELDASTYAPRLLREKETIYQFTWQRPAAGVEETIRRIGDFHRTAFTRIRQERADLWDERFGRYTYTITPPEEIAETIQKLRQRGYLRDVKKATDLGSGQGVVVHVAAAVTAGERIDVTGFEIDSALLGEARAFTKELSKQGLVDSTRIHWREENYLVGEVDLGEYDLLFMNPSIGGASLGAGTALGLMPSEVLQKLIRKMKPGALLVFSGKTYVSPAALKAGGNLEYLPKVRAFRRIGPSLQDAIERHLESAWPRIEGYEKAGNYTGVIEELQGLPEIPRAYRTAKIEQLLRHILPVQLRAVEFLGRPFRVRDTSIPEETRRQWLMAAVPLAVPLLVHRDLIPPEGQQGKRIMAILLTGMMLRADIGQIPREAAEKYLLDPALNLPERGVSFVMSSAASWELTHAAGQLLDRNAFDLHHPLVEWPIVKALAYYVISLSFEPTGFLADSFERDLLTTFIGFVGSYYGIGDYQIPTSAMRARYDVPLERVVKELKLGPVPPDLIRAVYREDKAALFNLAAIGAELLARVADRVGDDTQLHKWAGYYAREAHSLKHHRFFRTDLLSQAGLEEIRKTVELDRHGSPQPPAAGAEEVGNRPQSIEYTPFMRGKTMAKRLASSPGVHIWQGLVRVDDPSIVAVDPVRVPALGDRPEGMDLTIEVPMDSTNLSLAKVPEGLTVWVDPTLKEAAVRAKWDVQVEALPSKFGEAREFLRKNAKPGDLVLLDRQNYSFEMHQVWKETLGDLRQQGLWVTENELSTMDRNEFALTLQILRNSGEVLPAVGPKKEIQDTQYRFLFA